MMSHMHRFSSRPASLW